MKPRSPTIGILKTSSGNTGSIQHALTRNGIPSRIVETAEEIDAVNGLIFPGAGAAKPAMADLRKRKLVSVLRGYKKPFLGLCLGMQLLFLTSEEGPANCLGIIPGEVRRLPKNVMAPHMGWDKLSTGDYAYFVHSYVCIPDDPSVITQTVQYGNALCAAVRLRNFFGLQWHPEKSGDIGDAFLLSFAKLAEK
ncbi:MAG: imidazole glycerol phosphate synthase subunit HisH [Candidatus Peregrinibacteria bacterium]